MYYRAIFSVGVTQSILSFKTTKMELSLWYCLRCNQSIDVEGRIWNLRPEFAARVPRSTASSSSYVYIVCSSEYRNTRKGRCMNR